MNRPTRPIGVQRVTALFLAAALGFGGGLSVARAAVNKSDTAFVTKTATVRMLEVQASQAVITRIGNPDIRTSARGMMKDHTTASDELKTLAGKKGIVVPESLPADEHTKVDKLSTLEGARFDKVYIDKVGVKAHKGAVSLFDRASKDAKDPDIKVFFVHNLSALREHLQMAEWLKTAAK